MKVLLNLIYIFTLIICISFGIIGISLPNALTYMALSLVISLLGIILLDSVCTKDNRLMHINLYNTVCVFSILIALASIGITILFWLRVPGLEEKIYIKLGLKEEVIIDYNIDVYKYDNDFRLTYDYSKNVLSVYRNEGDIERLYNFSIYELNVQEQNDIRNNYHGKIDINKQNVIALYGTFNTSNHDDSIATPYIELTSGIYGIMGNQIIMDDVFTKLFNRENIFKYKLFTAEGQIKNGADLKNGIIEEYFTDKNFKYIYNGKRLYEDVYVCKDYASLTTQEKMEEYLLYLGMDRDKKVSNIIGKEIMIGNDNVNKIRLYYYNNLDSLNFIEIIFVGKKDSIIIKESDAKFKFDNIQKLY